jgi:CelD/BcsL family acetyltransferase involved in cellulose biosynthesis
MAVESISDPATFAAMRDEWNDLLRASASDNPFLTWEWLYAWWKHLGEPGTLHLIAVRSGGELVALAPLRLVNSALSWFARLEFLGTGHAGSDYLDIIVRRGRESESLSALAQYLQTHPMAARLNHLPPGSFAARLAGDVAVDGWSMSTVEDGTCPVIPLAGHTFDSYLATLGSSHRANVRRRTRALTQLGARLERVTTHRERCDLLAALVGYHERRWKERGGSSAFMTPPVVAFQDEATRLAMDQGWLRMYVLRLDDQAAAVMYGFMYGGRFYFYQHGFDDRYSTHSIGLVLMGMTIGAAIEEGAAEFDMLWGTEPYKFLWARDSRTLQRVELFPIHLGGTLHRHAIEAQRGVKRLARRVLAIGASLGT